jgi:hypothetical protein
LEDRGIPLDRAREYELQAAAEREAARRSDWGTCEGCRASKVKCDKSWPCRRCIRLKHRCRPARKRGVRDNNANNGAGAERGDGGVGTGLSSDSDQDAGPDMTLSTVIR